MMQLTSELFAQLISAAQAQAAAQVQAEPAAQTDRRRSPRSPADLEATLMPFSERLASENFEVSLRDLSQGGFGFFHDRPLPLGEQFALLLPEASGRPLPILCVVAYWQPMGDQLFSIGVRFCRVLREQNHELPLLVEDPDSGERSNLRAAS
jgi:hypothetical protein